MSGSVGVRGDAVVLGRNVVVETGAVVEAAEVGDGTVVEGGAVVGRGCMVGKVGCFCAGAEGCLLVLTCCSIVRLRPRPLCRRTRRCRITRLCMARVRSGLIGRCC